ncbi:MAG TPA: hypothetical protein VNM67_23305 [Thermoanaerobaculia bacterium]|jgi:hypothetical protein|nr:hypothetical protein [Thermoanaerobaculia bacterium]
MPHETFTAERQRLGLSALLLMGLLALLPAACGPERQTAGSDVQAPPVAAQPAG